MKNIEIFIPSWPENHDTVTKLGTADYGTYGLSCDSFNLSLRARQTSEGYVPEYHFRCWQDLGLHVFVQKEGGASVYLRALDVHSADLPQLEHLAKCLKWANKRLDLLKDKSPTLDSLPFYLMNLCTVLGIHRTVQYHGTCREETYAQVSSVLELIVAEAKRRWERLQ